MRQLFVVLGILLCVISTAAQDNSSSHLQLTPSSEAPGANDSAPVAPGSPTPISNAITVAALGVSSPSESNFNSGIAPSLPLASASSSADPAQQQPPTVAVYERYSWQLAANYVFFHFDEGHGLNPNSNGIIVEAHYYFKDWFAGEGEAMGTWGSQAGVSSHFVFAGGGPRVRWSLPRGIELFGHALVGGAHFVPQTPFGGQNAVGYILGGGVDVNAGHRRVAYRVGVDMVGTRFFDDNQFSPRVYVGFVFKF